MNIKHRNGVSFLEFPNFARFSGIRHGVFTRNTGKSSGRGPFQSLNVSFGIGDDDHNVRENRSIISRCMEEKDLVFAEQVHGIRVMSFTKEGKASYGLNVDVSLDGGHSKIPEEMIGGFDSDSERKLIGDALVTNIPKKYLVVQVADCQSILMHDPVRQVVANVHSGWRGSINNIIGRTIKEMEKNFACLSSDIVAGIGPSLGPCCAEFVNYEKEIPKAYWKYKDDRDHFDFWSVSCDQLCEAGVLIENVDISRLCTKCDPDRFFSFRGEGITGRFATIIGLK
ncbi:MAG: polyphenol oxidase family protein [Candidatus Thorarchaeota archaeon]